MATRTGKAAAGAGAGTAAILLVASLVALFEGKVSHTYADPIGIPTACYGHTGPDVTPGRQYTDDECDALLHGDLAIANRAVRRCIRVPMKLYEEAALTSFAFNVGEGALCSSTLARKANAGDFTGACAELSRWVYAKGLKLAGLVKRRAAERALCEGKT